LPFVHNNDVRLHYEEHGAGEPVIFLHGFTLDRRMWAGQAEFLKADYRVILADARGHGLSDAPPTGYSRDDRVADLLTLADSLEIEKFRVVGLSMGGVTAIGFALAYQKRLESLTLVSSGAAGYDFGKKLSRLDQIARSRGIEAARRKWKTMTLVWYKEGSEHIKALMETMIDDHSGAIWLDPMRGKYTRRHDLAAVHRITVPTKIIAGGSDQMFAGLSRELAGRIEGASLSIYDGVGHMVNLEAPSRFNDELKLFLEVAR
jgi:3-oxoadipate enol-lactonase